MINDVENLIQNTNFVGLSDICFKINESIKKLIEKDKDNDKIQTLVDVNLNRLRYPNPNFFVPSFFLFISLFLHSNKK